MENGIFHGMLMNLWKFHRYQKVRMFIKQKMQHEIKLIIWKWLGNELLEVLVLLD
ncbi:unnamed protein product [Brugia pahangi]|uniref:Uncharacterized protein n=1 Tax=Brugia pahangi TaxID=6280 RepID=A0A0N4TDS4_BRUPA|nr:unnamed protein product [Brugia pahangi]